MRHLPRDESVHDCCPFDTDLSAEIARRVEERTATPPKPLSALGIVAAIDRYFAERNRHYTDSPKLAGKELWAWNAPPVSFPPMTIAKTRRVDSRRTEIVRFGNEGMLGRVPGEKGSLGKIRPLKGATSRARCRGLVTP